MKMTWRLLNSPLIVLLLAFCLWPVVSAWQQRMVVRSTFTSIIAELNRTTSEINDQAKNSGIKTVVSSFVSQFIEGFTSAFDAVGEKQENKLANFTDALKQVSLSQVKAVPSGFSTREKIIDIIHNGSSAPISGIHLNITMFSADGTLLDVANEELRDVKLLQCGENISFTVDHDLGDSNQDKSTLDSRRAAKVTAEIVSFDVERPKAK